MHKLFLPIFCEDLTGGGIDDVSRETCMNEIASTEDFIEAAGSTDVEWDISCCGEKVGSITHLDISNFPKVTGQWKSVDMPIAKKFLAAVNSGQRPLIVATTVDAHTVKPVSCDTIEGNVAHFFCYFLPC